MSYSIELLGDVARHCRESIISWKLGAAERDPLVESVLEICRELELEGAHWSRAQIQHYLGFAMGVLLAKDILSAEHAYQLTTAVAQADGGDWDQHTASQAQTECSD